jgi:hypothetical protein
MAASKKSSQRQRLSALVPDARRATQTPTPMTAEEYSRLPDGGDVLPGFAVRVGEFFLSGLDG